MLTSYKAGKKKGNNNNRCIENRNTKYRAAIFGVFWDSDKSRSWLIEKQKLSCLRPIMSRMIHEFANKMKANFIVLYLLICYNKKGFNKTSEITNKLYYKLY